MIDIMFKKQGDQVLIRVTNRDLKFLKFQNGYLFGTDIEGLKFSPAGVIKQFPDLEPLENSEVIRIGKERFKEHIKSMKSEEEIKNYLMKDLQKHRYEAIYYQRKGHRIVKCH